MKSLLLMALLACTVSSYGQKNIALNQTYDANVYPETAKYAFDEIKSWGPPAWESRTNTGWISVVFNNVSDIDSITFEYSATPGNTTTQEIYTTVDGVTWTLYQTINLALNHTPNGGFDRLTYVFPSPIESTKGVRVKTIQNSSWVSWVEIEVWGNLSCSDIIVNDTLTNFVSNNTFQPTSPETYFKLTEKLTRQVGGCDSTVNHYTSYVYDPNNCTVTTNVTVQDTLNIYLSSIITSVYDASQAVTTVKVYPNPTNNDLTVEIDNYANLSGVTLKVLNAQSAEVHNEAVTSATQSIDVSSWTAGVYFLHILVVI